MYNYLKPGNHFAPSKKTFLNIIKAKDYYLIDHFNRYFVDLNSGLWNVSLGYSNLNDNIINHLSKSLKNGMFYIDTRTHENVLFEEYSQKLLNFINIDNYNFSKVTFTSSGSESNELALKLVNNISYSSNFSGKILAFKHSYHGTFFGSLSISGIKQQLQERYQYSTNNVIYIDFPTNKHSLQRLISLMEKEDIKAFFIEPVLSSRATLTMPIDYLDIILKTCNENNIISIFDEVATGFYKTGKRFYFHFLNHSPDLLILSKGINNGMLPFSCVVLNQKIYKKNKFLFNEHYSTQNGNILNLVVSDKTLDYYIEHEKFINKNVQTIEYLFQSVNLNLNLNIIGSMISIEIDDKYITELVTQDLKKNKILVNNYYFYENNALKSGISLRPPLNIDSNKLRLILKKIEYILLNYNHILKEVNYGNYDSRG